MIELLAQSLLFMAFLLEYYHATLTGPNILVIGY